MCVRHFLSLITTVAVLKISPWPYMPTFEQNTPIKWRATRSSHTRSSLRACLMMDISSPHLPFLWCSQLTERLDICINRAATEHNFPVWNSQRILFRLINSSERCAFKSAYLFSVTWRHLYSRMAVCGLRLRQRANSLSLCLFTGRDQLISGLADYQIQ